MFSMKKIPGTLSFTGEALLSHAACAAEDAELLACLRSRADAMMGQSLLSVTQRKIRGESGDAHDYASFGPYWWPNPDTENGLPYIRRDGLVNPETKDPVTWGKLFDTVQCLALATLYFGEEAYARRAVEQIRVWYIDSATRCHPHMKYAQAIPGICAGRGIGLIDTAPSFHFLDAVQILDAMGFMDCDTMAGVKDWYNRFTDWMLCSENGADEDSQHNNHGTWYDVQIGAAALFLERPLLANRALFRAYDRRILRHIRPDGQQPYELARTNGMSYSVYNLRAMTEIADLSRRIKKPRDLWHETRPAGDVALRSAIDYITQFSESLDGFPYQQISGKPETDGCAQLLYMAAREYPGEGYEERCARLYTPQQLWRLLP